MIENINTYTHAHTQIEPNHKTDDNLALGGNI